MFFDIRDNIVREVFRWVNKYILYCIVMEQLGFFIGVVIKLDIGVGVYYGYDFFDDEWELVFVIEGVVYYKNKLMYDFDL